LNVIIIVCDIGILKLFFDCCIWTMVCVKGFELSYWSAVFITSVGHISEFPSAKQLTGLCGISVGVGEIVGLYIMFLCYSVFQLFLIVYSTISTVL